MSGEIEELRSLVSRLEKRFDTFEAKAEARFERTNDKLQQIVEGQIEMRSNSKALDHAFEEIANLKAVLKPLQEQQPFVEMVTDSLKGILRNLLRAAWIIGASILVAQAWPYLPFTPKPTIPVEIKPSTGR